jgi:hypothetical protein
MPNRYQDKEPELEESLHKYFSDNFCCRRLPCYGFFAEYFSNHGDDAYQRQKMIDFNPIVFASFVMGVLGYLYILLYVMLSKK